MYWMTLKAVRGEQPRFADFFVAFTKLKWFVGLFVLYILQTIFVILGCVALILPGIYLAVAFTFVEIAMVDRNLGIWDSLKFSCERINPYWWEMLGLHILTFFAMIVGILCLCVGAFIAFPITYIAIVYAYDAICGGGFPPNVQCSEAMERSIELPSREY